MAFLARFPMPAVVLSALLAVGHLVLRISDDLRPPLFLQPASTIIRPQQVVTAGLFEDSAPNLLVVVLALLYSAKALQPAWGDRECVRFVMLVNVLHLSASSALFNTPREGVARTAKDLDVRSFHPGRAELLHAVRLHCG